MTLLDGKLDLDEDGSRPEGMPSRGWVMGAAVCVFPIYIAFSVFGMDGKGTAATIAALTLIFAVKLNSQFVRQFRFWAVIVSIAIVNALLIAYIPIPNKNYTFPIVAPFGYADYLLISACIGCVEKKVKIP